MNRAGGLSFRSAQELNTKIAQLPQPPPWKSREITVDCGTSKKKVNFLYREGLDVYRFAYGNPLFAGHQQNIPLNVWADFENDIKVYSEPMTCDLPHAIQVRDG